MSYVLTEMAVVHPVAGAFGVYAEKYLNPWAGFSVRATYGVAQIIAIGAEVTAAGIYISFLAAERSAVDLGRAGFSRPGGAEFHAGQSPGRV